MRELYVSTPSQCHTFGSLHSRLSVRIQLSNIRWALRELALSAEILLSNTVSGENLGERKG